MTSREATQPPGMGGWSVSGLASVVMNNDSIAGGDDPVIRMSSAEETPAATGRSCPHCGSVTVQRWGAARGLPRYRCGDCRRTFNPLTGTSLARLRSKDKWFLFLHTVTQQKSIRKSAEICGVDNTTVLRWRQRFKACTPVERRSILMALTETCSTSMQTLQQAAAEHAPEQGIELLLTILGWLG
jgi:transposase-like protein